MTGVTFAVRMVMASTPVRGELWWEALGEPGARNVVLHPGAGDTADVFPLSFCERLLDAADCVVRFDPRDTGRSARTDESTPYDIAAMADDLWAVADAAGVELATLLGYSFGGVVVQQAALRRPERVAAMVLLATLARPPEMELTAEALDQMVAPPDASADDLIPLGPLQVHGGSDDDLDELGRRYAGGRGPTWRANRRHTLAGLWGPIPSDDELASIAAPVLVVHSIDDRVVPHRQANAIARPYQHATVERLTGIGHVPFERQWLDVADLVLAAPALRTA